MYILAHSAGGPLLVKQRARFPVRCLRGETIISYLETTLFGLN